MNPETQRVDVLAAIDNVAKWARHAPTLVVPLRESRAAVAELIEASSRLVVHSDGRAYFESGTDTERFRAALARIGAKP